MEELLTVNGCGTSREDVERCRSRGVHDERATVEDIARSAAGKFKARIRSTTGNGIQAKVAAIKAPKQPIPFKDWKGKEWTDALKSNLYELNGDRFEILKLNMIEKTKVML